MTKLIHTLLIACVGVALSGCGPNVRECHGDVTVRCHNVRITAAAAKIDLAIAETKAQDDTFIKALGEARYQRLLELQEAAKDAILDSRPNLFMRLFMGDREWAYPGSKFPYSQRRELEQILASAQRTTAASKQAPTANGDPFALDPCVDEIIKAFRRTRGDDAVVRRDMLDEWTQQCKAGGK